MKMIGPKSPRILITIFGCSKSSHTYFSRGIVSIRFPVSRDWGPKMMCAVEGNVMKWVNVGQKQVLLMGKLTVLHAGCFFDVKKGLGCQNKSNIQ